ncbi:uncharacterized protein LOC129565148 [Sitodiplosis mosellana]|uniref:uncharacterized protein LOC129565148 n=1 Tax=Sitodiplosis mosellana TaxID=263140 RepID=UPI0024438DE7|nr:uncharacterized protein LOC129565148 [Sitodiplosis mosellana]
MSQPNVMEVNSPQQNVEQNQNQAAIARKIQWYVQLYGGPQPQVFKLNTNCWDNIFDWLSLEDVLSFGRTCKAFKWVAGEYFKENYPKRRIFCRNGDEPILNDFSEYVQIINWTGEITESNAYLLSNCKSLKRIDLFDTTLTESSINTLGSALKTVEEISLKLCEFEGRAHEHFVKRCVNLKFLDTYGMAKNRLLQKYSTLERLKLVGPVLCDELNRFFKLNPNVRNLTVEGCNVGKIRRYLIDSNIKLDDLTIEHISERESDFIDSLNKLHLRGFYKHLHIDLWNSPSKDQLAALQGLVTLHIHESVLLPSLPNLKELGFHADLTTIRNEGLNVTEIPNLCINLQRLFILTTSVDDILPFIRHSPHLVQIEIGWFKEKSIDLQALNKERKNLKGAQKVTIYVEEYAYLATKWASTEINVSFITIRRCDSHKVKLAHTLL